MTTAPAREEGVELKSLAAVPFGITTTALAIAFAVYAAVAADFSIVSVSIFLIFPIGAILVGLLAGSGLAVSLWLMHIRPTTAAYAASLVLGFACFLGIYYGIYDRAYVNAEYDINYDGEGSHISTFINPDTGEPYTFWDYLDIDVSNRELSMYHNGHESASIDMSGSVGGGVSWFLFGLEALGLVAGAFSAVEILSHLDYCPSCRQYMKGAGSVSIVPQALPTVWPRLRTATPDLDGLSAATIDVERPGPKEPYVRIDVSRCTGCQAGQFTARSFTKQDADKDYQEVTSARLKLGVASPLTGLSPTSGAEELLTRQPSIYDRDYNPRQPAL